MYETLDQYLDAAKARRGFRSDRDLDRALGARGASTSTWRTKRAWPSDGAMLTIAEWAGASPDTALLQLNAWRSEGPARLAYLDILRRIAAAILCLAVAQMFPHETKAEQNVTSNAVTVYYGK